MNTQTQIMKLFSFQLLQRDIELVESPFNAAFNIQKANWSEFKQQLKQESTSLLKDLQQVTNKQSFTLKEMEDIACQLRDLIIGAANNNIPRRKPCSKSKVWWSDNLTLLRKEMARENRVYKRHNQSQHQWEKFTTCRAEYFQAIKKAKQNSWSKFLSESRWKNIFQAYKYTKPRLMQKIPPIQASNGELCQDFNKKCETFIKAMYPKPPEISQNTLTQGKQASQPEQWQELSNNEVKQAINTSLPKKASGPDEISFAIIQEAYKAISEVMNLVYKILIRNGFHSEC